MRMNLQTKLREAKLLDGDDGTWLHKKKGDDYATYFIQQ